MADPLPGASAPLIATPGAPVPAGMSAFWFEGARGARLRAAIAGPTGVPRGSVVLSPGRSEPIEKYFEVVSELQGRGFCVLVHDWRCQGLSQRLLGDRHKGHACGADDYLTDFRRLLAVAGPQLPGPWVGMGHSMGGALMAMDLMRGGPPYAALFLSAPMMGLAAVRVPLWAGRLLARAVEACGGGEVYVAKNAFEPMLGPFASNILTHDERRYERYRAQLRACPDLALGGVTWGWLRFALDAGAQLSRPPAGRAATMPLTVVAAGEDRLVSSAAARRYAERARQGRYLEIPGAYHELLVETDARRALVWRAFDDLLARAGVD